MPAPKHAAVVDARAATRARQPGRANLREVVVTVTQVATGRRQAVRVAAADERGARALAMIHCTLLGGAPRDLSPASLALRHLEFTVLLGNSGSVEPCEPVPPAQMSVAPTAATAAGPHGYAAYSVVIATDPRYWAAGGAEPSLLEARRRAETLADATRDVFPGLRCDLVPGPVEKLDLSSGPAPGVREGLEAWVDARMGEMLCSG